MLNCLNVTQFCPSQNLSVRLYELCLKEEKKNCKYLKVFRTRFKWKFLYVQYWANLDELATKLMYFVMEICSLHFFCVLSMVLEDQDQLKILFLVILLQCFSKSLPNWAWKRFIYLLLYLLLLFAQSQS